MFELSRWQTLGFTHRLNSLEAMRRPLTKANIAGSSGCRGASGTKYRLRQDSLEDMDRAMSEDPCWFEAQCKHTVKTN